MAVAFHDFGNQVFEQATAERKPVLLLLTVSWCAHCRELCNTTFADERVERCLQDSFIVVKADAERRPDVNARYGLGGWPTIAWLTSSGSLIAQDRFLTGEQLQARAKQVQEALRAKIEPAIGDLPEPPTEARRLDSSILEHIGDAIYGAFDHRYGGWGETSKFPHSEAIDYALVMTAKGLDSRMSEVATLTLDSMTDSPIHDRVDGGFFRFSRTRDWRSPNFEKVLEANAQRLRCYIEAYQLFKKPSYREASEGIIRWMLESMLDPEHEVFYGSMDADPDYYARDAEGRSGRPKPPTDKTIYTNSNAMAISALLKASLVLDRPELRDRAMRATHFLLENAYDGAGTVYHYWDGTYHLPGMLSDQAYMIRALIDLSQHSGNADLLLPAEAIAEKAVAEQKAPEGGFYDILHDPRSHGAMRRRNKSILENAVMAEALVRLSYLSRRPDLYAEAVQTLEAFADGYKQYGYYVAGYGRAVDLIFYPPLTVTIVGDRESEEADALRRAALVSYLPSRIVQMLDPRHDPILMERAGYDPDKGLRAYISVGKTTMAAVETPEELVAKIDEVEQGRRES